MVTSRSKLLLSDMYGFMVLQQPGSQLLSMAPVTIMDHVDTWDLVNHLRPCWYHRGHTNLGGVHWGHGDTRAHLLWKVHGPPAAQVWVDLHDPCYRDP